MKTNPVRLVVLACALALLMLTLTFRVVSAGAGSSRSELPLSFASFPLSAAKSELAAPVQQGGVTTATLRAATGRTILFKTNNGVSPTQESDLPQLILYENGVLNPNADERTLIVEVHDIKVPPGGVTVTVKAETQHGDPNGSTRIRGVKTGTERPTWL